MINLAGVNKDTGQPVAIKLEHNTIYLPVLESEADICRELAGGVGIPQLYWDGGEYSYHAMVFELLGPILEDLFNFCNRRFSLKTVLMLADQIIHRIEFIHSKNVVHADIQPGNLLMGLGREGNTVFLTDFGISRQTKYEETQDYATSREKWRSTDCTLCGNPPFASLMGHVGGGIILPLSFSPLSNDSDLDWLGRRRADDLESLGYILVRFLHGSLSWDGLMIDDRNEKIKTIHAKKEEFDPSQVGDDIPRDLTLYFDHVRSLGLNEKPKYAYLRKIFRDLFVRRGFAYDRVYDWSIRMYALANPPQERRESVKKRTKLANKAGNSRLRRKQWKRRCWV